MEGKEDGKQLRESFVQSWTHAELFESASHSESVGHVPEREGSTNEGSSAQLFHFAIANLGLECTFSSFRTYTSTNIGQTQHLSDEIAEPYSGR